MFHLLMEKEFGSVNGGITSNIRIISQGNVLILFIIESVPDYG